ncbi:MAG: hypothetical protein ACYC9J_11630 [Sulfuricaulis sp.]
MNKDVTAPKNLGVTVFKTTPYGEHTYNGSVRIYFRNEVRVVGSVYRVVEVTMRGRPGAEVVLCVYVAPTEYPHLMQAISAAVHNCSMYRKTQPEGSACSARVVMEGRGS